MGLNAKSLAIVYLRLKGWDKLSQLSIQVNHVDAKSAEKTEGNAGYSAVVERALEPAEQPRRSGASLYP